MLSRQQIAWQSAITNSAAKHGNSMTRSRVQTTRLFSAVVSRRQQQRRLPPQWPNSSPSISGASVLLSRKASFTTLPVLQRKKDRGFFEPADLPAKPNDDKLQSSEEGTQESSSAKAPENRPEKAVEAGTSQSLQDRVQAKEGISPETTASGASDGTENKASAAAGSGAGTGGEGSDDGSRKGKKDKQDKALERPGIPEIYPQVLALPIARRPLFPGFYKAVTVSDPNVTAAMLELIKHNQPYIGVFMMKDETSNKDTIDDPSEVHDVGVFAQITSAFPVHGDKQSLTAILYPHRRIRLTELMSATSREPRNTTPEKTVIVPEPIPAKAAGDGTAPDKKGDVVASFEEGVIEEKAREKAGEKAGEEKAGEKNDITSDKIDTYPWLSKYPVSLANVENLRDEPHDPRSQVVRAMTNEIVNVFKQIASMNQLFRDQVSTFSISQAGNVTADPAKLADFAAAVSAGEPEELQEILASLDIDDRMQRALIVLKKELMNAELQSKITRDVETKITKRQREYWLKEQMKGIKRELGIESDGKDKLVDKFKQKADSLNMPQAARQVFDDEINKLAHLEPAASEFNVTRNYLDWLTQIPWGKRSKENFGIKNAMKVLDEDHYGLKDVKDRILEFIAVGKLRGSVEGKILCFVGPPGVGKTSIGKSIARALNRKYYRFSVGGLSDVAEIKGHRRTYVGALPGRIIQALKKCQTENPLILIDEIDKIGKGHQGDPASALLELLDPEQNNSFLDHYMDVPVDLSKVLFVCTANIVHTIPQPLYDRMEVIRLSGYVADEKMAIAEKYLAPQAKEQAGLKNASVELSSEAIEELIKSYCRESGVRNLKKHIEKVYRKSALKIVGDMPEEEPVEEKKEPVVDEADQGSAKETSKETSKIDEKKDPKSTGGSSSGNTSNNATTPLPPKVARSEQEKTPSTTSPSSGTGSTIDVEPQITGNTEATDTSDGATTEDPPKPLIIPSSVHVKVSKDNLSDYVGPPVFTTDRLYNNIPVGVALGLAVGGMGGSAMYIESILQKALRPTSVGAFTVTGNLRKVMEESAAIAYSFTKGFMIEKFPKNHFFERANIHVHVPEGAISKDGPSAGITMATSFLSLALDTPVKDDVAMTGELTLTGKVLRIGGLQEKVVAAKRAGCHMVIFPKDNMSDWLELSDAIKKDIEGRPVEWYHEVFDMMFPTLDKEKANECKACQMKKQDNSSKQSRSRKKDDSCLTEAYKKEDEVIKEGEEKRKRKPAKDNKDENDGGDGNEEPDIRDGL